MDEEIALVVDGERRTLTVDTRTTVLDALREKLDVTAPKKGCDHGQCGACTILLDGRRALACLALAVAHDEAEITTAAGLSAGTSLHPVAQAIMDHDGLQCGYCTPGQVCSAVGMLNEVKHGWPSYTTPGLADPFPSSAGLNDGEIRERMSGNLCRCGAYVNIIEAIRQEAAR